MKGRRAPGVSYRGIPRGRTATSCSSHMEAFPPRRLVPGGETKSINVEDSSGEPNLPSARPVQHLICRLQWKYFGFGPNWHAGSNDKKFLAVLAGEVRDRADGPLLPEPRGRKARNVAHMNSGADHGSSLVDGSERERHEVADGREDDRGVQWLGRAQPKSR